jgi:hypothetical protein
MSFRANTNAKTAAIFAGLLLLVVWAAMGLRATNADGIAAEVVQPAGKAPKPSCPTPEKKDDPAFQPPASKVCQAVGEVTGLQRVANGERNPYKIPNDGRIVAFGVSLSKPSDSERSFFTDAPDSGPSVKDGVGWGDPSVKLSIVKKLKHQRFKLVKQSVKVDISGELGRNPIFTLNKPLKVKAGLFVAITTGNWMPALAHDPPAATTAEDQWLASRGSKHCGNAPAGATVEQQIAAQQDSIDHSKPQNKLGSVRSYACTYTAARLLYRAYFVPDSGDGGGGSN